MRRGLVAATILGVMAAGATLAGPPAHARHHRGPVHRRPASRAPLHLSGEISAASAPDYGRAAVAPSGRRRFADEEARPSLTIDNRLAPGTTAALGVQSRAGGALIDRSEMSSAAASGRQPSANMLGLKLTHPF